MGNWQDYVNNKYKSGEKKQSYAEHVKEKYGNTNAKEEAVEKAASSAPKYVGWGSKAQPDSVKRVTAEEAARKKQEAQKASLGSNDAVRKYNQNRINAMLEADRKNRQSKQDTSAALAALQETAEESGNVLPAFKRNNLTGNERFEQSEATGQYNPYEDAMNAIKARMQEEADRKAREAYNKELQMQAEKPQTLGDLLANGPAAINQMPINKNALEQTLEVENIKRDEEKRKAYEAENQKPETLPDSGYSVADWASANTKAGWTQIGGRLMQSINTPFEFAQDVGADLGQQMMGWVFGDKYAEALQPNIDKIKEEPALGALYDWAVDPMEKATAYAETVNAQGGKLAQIGGSVIQNAVNMVPNALIALMSGGANTALDAFNRAQTTFGGAVLDSAKKMATSPGFLNSFLQMFGGRYEEAEAAGANPYQAALTATLTTLLNSAVEMGGGVEDLPFTKATVGEWIKNALDEGKEEVIQQVIDQLGQKAFVDGNIPWYSAEDQNAVINPKVLGENALLGTLAGGIISGPGMVLNNSMNANVQDQTERFDGAPEISDIAMELIQEENKAGLDGKTGKYPEVDAIERMALETADAEIAEEARAKPEEWMMPATDTDTESAAAEPAVRTESATEPVRAERAEADTETGRIENAALRSAAEKYGEAATVFRANYEGGDIDAYDKAFGALYSAGQVNLTLDKIGQAADALTAGMSDATKRAIWQAGRNADVKTIKPGVQQRTTVKLTDRQKRQFKMLDVMAKRFQYEIDIVDSIASGRANGAYTGGRRIVVAADAAEGAIVQTGVHELVHGLKANDEAGYRVLEEVVLKHLQSEGSFALENAISRRMQEYAAGGQNLTREDAIEEIVCEAVPTFLTDEAAVKAFVRENRTLAEKIRDFFVNFAKEIREIAEKYMLRENVAYDRDEIAALLGRSDALTEIAQTFDRAMEAAGEKEAADGGKVVFARNEGERNRALKVGEMINRFRSALTSSEWKRYYGELNKKHYDVGLFDDGQRTLMWLDGKLLLMQMQENGEFSVEDVSIRSEAWYNENLRDLMEGVEDGEYSVGRIEAWLQVAEAGDGPSLFGSNDRYSYGTARTNGEKNSAGRGTAGVSGERDAYREGLRENAVRQTGSILSAEGEESKFSLNKPVEQVGDLVAVHNVDPEGLARSLNLGGVPAPSIAVVKSSSGHSKFGTVSLVFNKNSIDPEADARNKVYGYDAWTPDKKNARIEYEVNERVEGRAKGIVYGLAEKLPEYFKRKAFGFVDSLGEKLNSDGMEGLIEKAADNYGMRAAYLESIGQPVTMERTTRTEGGISEEARAKLEAVAEIFDHDAEYVGKTSMKDIVEQYGDQIAAAWQSKMSWTKERYMRVIQRVYSYLRGELDARTVEVDDIETTERKISEAVREDDFRQWLHDLFDGLQGRAGIVRDVDPYDRHGNRKSFSQTHYEVTAENIVRALYENAERKGANFMGASAEGIAAVASKEYKSINAIRKDKGRLYVEDADAHDARYQKLDDELNAIMDDVYSVNPYADMDAAATAIMNAAQDGSRTAAAIVRSFKKNGLTIDKGIGERIAAMYKGASEFPTGYFEAKPERVVGFDEVRAAIVPDSMDAGVRRELDKVVENVIVYPDGDEDARLKALNSLPDIRFSLNNTSSIETALTEDQNLMLPTDVNVKAESIRAQAAAALERGLNERMEQQITGVANKILRETKSKYKKADMISNLKALIDEYRKNGATEDTARAVAEMAKKIIEQSERTDETLREQYKDVRKWLRENGLSLTDSQKQEAANNAGSYDAWRKSMMGTLKLTDGGMTLEEVWAQLSEKHPELFPADTREGDMITKLEDFRDLMKPKYENPYGMDMEGAALEMAMRIQGDIMGVIGAKDAAQQMYGSAEKIRKEFEKEYKAKLAQQKKERVDKFQQIASDLKAAKAKGDSAEQANVMSRYRAALKATALDEAYAEIRATYKEREAQRAENRKANEMRGKVAKRAGELMNMFARPEKGKRIPTGLQGMVLDALELLDINGERAETEGRQNQKALQFREKLNGIRTFYEGVIESQSKGEPPEGMGGLMMAFSERNLQYMREALEVLGGGGDKFRLRDMNSDQLRSLDELLKGIKHTVESVGKLWKNHRYQSVVQMGDAFIEESDERGGQKTESKALRTARDFFALDMMEPVSYGERLGEAGKAVIQSLMDGEKIKFAKVRDAAAATKRMQAETGVTGLDIGKWRKNVRKVKLGSGRIAKMSDVNLMELYLTANRPQGLQHMLANGMKIQESKATGPQALHFELTQADINEMIGMLTDKQKALADRMQKYLSVNVAKWGNDVTQRLYLYDAFTDEKYWPISSDPNSLKTQAPEGDRAFNAITDAGFTKPLNAKATNEIVIGDAFDTFNRHISEMASYAGYAEVMTDTMNWLNYRQRSEEGKNIGSVKESMENLLGEDGIKYLTKLVQDINGARRGGDNTQFAGALGKLTGNAKKAAVAGKIRVAIQQWTSIVRAAAEINPVFLISKLGAGKKTIAEMQKWSSLAWWKSNGNYEIGIGKSTDQIFWGDTSRIDSAIDTAAKVFALGMDPGKMDDATWAQMWTAVKSEIKHTRKDLKVGSDEYFRAVTERFEYIMDRTQVVDTIMHRSDLMRSKDGIAKALTAFMGEPIKSYNMLMRTIMNAGRNPKDPKAYGKVARAYTVYAASAAAVVAMTALFDSLKYRDDDEEFWEYFGKGTWAKKWLERWLDNLPDAFNPLNDIPIVSQVIDIINGGDVPTITALDGVEDAVKAAKTTMNYFAEGNTGKYSAYGVFKALATAGSTITGLPVNGMLANMEMLTHAYDPELLQTKSNMATTEQAFEKLYQAVLSGDKAKVLEIRTELAKGMYGKNPKTPKEIDTGIAHALAENDERVMQAYNLRAKGNRTEEVKQLKKLIMADGFTDAQVTAAINYCETLVDTVKEPKDMEEQLTAKMYTKNDLYASIRNGDVTDVAAVAEYLESVSTAQDPAQSLRDSVSDEFKAEYIGLVDAGNTKQANELAEKLAVFGYTEDDLHDWMKKDRTASLKKAIEDGDMRECEKLVEVLRDEYGMDDETIASTVRSRFKQDYIDMVIAGDDKGAEELAEKLIGLGLKYADGNNRFKMANLNKWVLDWEKAQKE